MTTQLTFTQCNSVIYEKQQKFLKCLTCYPEKKMQRHCVQCQVIYGIKINNKKSQFYLYINNYTSGFIPQTVPMRLYFFVNYYILKYEKLGHIAMPISNPSVREILYTQEASAAIISKCRNAGKLQKRLVGYRYFFRYSTVSIRHRHSGFRISQVPLVTD